MVTTWSGTKLRARQKQRLQPLLLPGDHVVWDQITCQAEAEAAGHSYYQWAPDSSSCNTAATCSPYITGTSWSWQIYHCPGGDCTGTEATETVKTWSLIADDNSKCANDGEYEVTDQAACQADAEAAGHHYYNWYSANSRCGTAATCNSPITGTSWAWQIYEMSEVAAAASEALWPQDGEDNSRCQEDTTCSITTDNGGIECPCDITQAECQSNAVAGGASYYVFDAARGCCQWFATCTPNTGTSNEWKIHKNPEAATAATFTKLGDGDCRCDTGGVDRWM